MEKRCLPIVVQFNTPPETAIVAVGAVIVAVKHVGENGLDA
jgi:hypothetical protein